MNAESPGLCWKCACMWKVPALRGGGGQLRVLSCLTFGSSVHNRKGHLRGQCGEELNLGRWVLLLPSILGAWGMLFVHRFKSFYFTIQVYIDKLPCARLLGGVGYCPQGAKCLGTSLKYANKI